jgi:ankyrin repeat protein
MTEAYRYYVRSPDGRAIFGFETSAAAETAATAYGEGAHIVDTLAQAYRPMLQEVRDGALVIAGFGGWDTGRFGLDRDLIEAIKKGHVALPHAFLAKGADPNTRDQHSGPALHWAVAGGRVEIVKLLLDAGAEVQARDGEGQSALDLAQKRGKDEIAEVLRKAGAGE